jgi:hypothetical protein
MCLAVAAEAGVTVHSRSGQFVVHCVRPTVPTLAQLVARTNQPPLVLQPDALAVTAERVKSAILQGLGRPDRWEGKIQLWIQPKAPAADFVPVLSTRFADGWRYSVHLPEEIDPAVLTRTLTHAVLLEMANRTPGPHVAEIPIWLMEGFTGQILTRVGADAVVRPNALVAKTGNSWGELVPTSISRRGGEHLLAMRRQFGLRQPLSFNELSLPPPELLRGENLKVYRLCAQLLLEELQRLPRGRNSLVAMIGSLTRAMNWQTAFQAAFAAHFGRLLDTEQWWAVAWQQFNGTGDRSGWTLERTLYTLDEALRVVVSVQEGAGESSRRTAMTLQQVIQDPRISDQTALLQAKLNQLRLIEGNAPLGAKELARGYAQTIERFLTEEVRDGTSPVFKRRLPISRKLLVRQTLDQLEQLDAQRRAIVQSAGRPAPGTDGLLTGRERLAAAPASSADSQP